ncbi:MAG: hypothetical protein KA072_13415 [Thermoanaerobaculaceae bacterium]|nr:hypothetical protein [Thermoanaerobaculaceae bacterium]MDI9621768.1 hypothetical protein [Acidobacteriota bacterium]NLH11348.1 hypothetical protein [Holophagae bacterium]HPW56188.1 hypothetical protein [Thermoanaerobaculaceae bacterium]
MTASRSTLINAAITELAAGMTTAGLYGIDHPRAEQIIERLASHLGDLLHNESELTFVLLGEELFVQGVPVTASCRQAPSVIRRMRRRGLEHVGFRLGVTPAELSAFLAELAGPEDVAVQSRPHIQVGKIEVSEIELGGPDDATGGHGRRKLASVRDRIAVVDDCLTGLAGGSGLAIGDLERVVKAILDSLADDPDPIHHLAPWQGEAQWPALRAYNTCVLTLGLAHLAGIDATASRDLGLAALLADTGKLFVPAELQARELELDGDELELVVDHPRTSLEVLLGCGNVPPIALIVAYEHHLGFNGTGYPRLPRPRRPHPVTRLVSAAVAFVILHTLRGGTGRATRESAAAWMAERSGTLLDPGWVSALAELLEAEPV